MHYNKASGAQRFTVTPRALHKLETGVLPRSPQASRNSGMEPTAPCGPCRPERLSTPNKFRNFVEVGNGAYGPMRAILARVRQRHADKFRNFKDQKQLEPRLVKLKAKTHFLKNEAIFAQNVNNLEQLSLNFCQKLIISEPQSDLLVLEKKSVRCLQVTNRLANVVVLALSLAKKQNKKTQTHILLLAQY